MGRIIPYIMENKKCSKPPTSDMYELVTFVARSPRLVMVLFQACILTMAINLAELSSPIVGMEKTEQDQFW